jgi:hypothetical protein
MAPVSRNNWPTHLIAHFPVPAKKGSTLNAQHPAVPNDLFICCPLDLEQVEAHLFTFDLGQLINHSQRLTLQERSAGRERTSSPGWISRRSGSCSP